MQNHRHVYSNEDLNRLFPAAKGYRGLQKGVAPLVCEERTAARPFPYSERHLQCLWHDARLRPGALQTLDGEDVVVEHSGVWNLEAGPDFLGAALRIGPRQRRLCGDVEVHIDPSGWHAHGHDRDPRYEQVRVHVTWFPGVPDTTLFPAGAIHIALKEYVQANPYFSFESIDTTAYPYAAREEDVPCARLLRTWSPEQKISLLTAAGQERIRRKAERMALAIEERGDEQVLYEELMCAMGYKNNKLPFRHLAQRLPADMLRREAGTDAMIAYALLAGVSGLLPAQPCADWPADTRAFIRVVWDHWWKRSDAWSNRVMSRHQWRLSGVRPVNHPLRRMMAPALLLTQQDSLIAMLRGYRPNDVLAFIRQATGDLTALESSYWSHHRSMQTAATDFACTLIGEQRASAIISNVYIPFLAATGQGQLFAESLLNALPCESKNALIRQTAHTLFGRDHQTRLYDQGLLQQGLLQIFHDFCLNDRSRCGQCPLPDALRAYHG